LRTKIKDKDTLWVLDMIVDSCDCGLPIGSYLSQYLSNFYLSTFDHWCKEVLNIKYIIRYMDDIVILVPNKELAHYYLYKIQEYLQNNLLLKLKPNY